MKATFTTLLLILSLAGMAQKHTTFSLICQKGGLSLTGGSFVQHNSITVNRVNTLSCGNYVITVCGKKEAMQREDGSADACYFQLSLADGKLFHSGDEIIITGMRNINKDKRATLYFLYDNGTSQADDNTWNNLGILEDMTFGGTTTSKKTLGAGTEPLVEFSMFPSTFTFTVPAEAEGSASLKIALNDSETFLYLTAITIKQDDSTAISTITSTPSTSKAYTVTGVPASNAYSGITIKDGKKWATGR